MMIRTRRWKLTLKNCIWILFNESLDGWYKSMILAPLAIIFLVVLVWRPLDRDIFMYLSVQFVAKLRETGNFLPTKFFGSEPEEPVLFHHLPIPPSQTSVHRN